MNNGGGGGSCPTSWFSCANGDCIMVVRICDGTKQCHDGSDEQNCGTSGSDYVFNDPTTTIVLPTIGACLVLVMLMLFGIKKCKEWEVENIVELRRSRKLMERITEVLREKNLKLIRKANNLRKQAAIETTFLNSENEIVLTNPISTIASPMTEEQSDVVCGGSSRNGGYQSLNSDPPNQRSCGSGWQCSDTTTLLPQETSLLPPPFDQSTGTCRQVSRRRHSQQPPPNYEPPFFGEQGSSPPPSYEECLFEESAAEAYRLRRDIARSDSTLSWLDQELFQYYANQDHRDMVQQATRTRQRYNMTKSLKTEKRRAIKQLTESGRSMRSGLMTGDLSGNTRICGPYEIQPDDNDDDGAGTSCLDNSWGIELSRSSYTPLPAGRARARTDNGNACRSAASMAVGTTNGNSTSTRALVESDPKTASTNVSSISSSLNVNLFDDVGFVSNGNDDVDLNEPAQALFHRGGVGDHAANDTPGRSASTMEGAVPLRDSRRLSDLTPKKCLVEQD